MNKCTPISPSSTCSNFLCKNSESHRIVQAHLAPRLRLRSITLPLELRASYCAFASRKHSSAVGSVSFTQATSVTLTSKTNAHQFKLNCSMGKYVMQQLKKVHILSNEFAYAEPPIHGSFTHHIARLLTRSKKFRLLL